MDMPRLQRSRVDLHQLRAFLVLWESSSITEAADLLGVSQPSLSQLLARLEESLGVRLFDRGRRGLQPTVEARQLQEAVTVPVQQLVHVLRIFQPAEAQPQVAICAGTTSAALDRALALLGWESSQIEWLDIPTARQAALIMAGRLDAAVGREPIGYARSLGRYPLGIEVGVNSPLFGRSRVSYADLQGYRLAWIQEQQTASHQRSVIDHIHEHGWEPELVSLPPRTALLRSALTADDHLVVLRPREDHRPWIKLDDPPHEEFWLST